ncbi:unnamed protein product [Fusarium graminearum]|uniref:Chromosome 4, complete genome n=1 Tax=Gibberella zeae (strain ATCC MYA-4620 / CBS 123657 / FGSC 9075 / NRRL 31084 / PH-1) TaxID=229533 RepID=A0A098DPQ3_GIBZE|nr:unnamed protein product [Fusarium graminearum]
MTLPVVDSESGVRKPVPLNRYYSRIENLVCFNKFNPKVTQSYNSYYCYCSESSAGRTQEGDSKPPSLRSSRETFSLTDNMAELRTWFILLRLRIRLFK